MDAKLRVAICGGGIGGLCLAVALSKAKDIHVQVYEAAEKFTEIGAGVMIWSRTWAILSELGLEEDFARIASWSPCEERLGGSGAPDGSLGVGFDFRRSDRSEKGFRFKLFTVPYGCICFHRSDFLDVLVKHLSEEVACFRKRVVSYVATDEVTVNFNDGTSAICDVLVGCDGIKSTIRKQLFESLASSGFQYLRSIIEPRFLGTIAYRGLISAHELPRYSDGRVHDVLQRPMMYCGKSKHIVCYSISQGDLINVVALDNDSEHNIQPPDGPWVTNCTSNELLQCYDGFETEALDILRMIKQPRKWWLHELGPSDIFVSEKVALVGDAIHAMAPHQGAGAGQAIEDAYILSQLLAHPSTTKETLHLALKSYEYVRAPMANHVLKESRTNGTMYEFDAQGLEDDYPSLGDAIERQFAWIGSSSPRDEAKRAIQHFTDSLC